MGLGNQIVEELGRRGIVGQFFDYTGYQQLRLVENGESLRRFLQKSSYQSPPLSEDASEVVDYLIAVNQKMERDEAPWVWTAILTGLFDPFAGLFFWMGSAILRFTRGTRKHL